jgi:hypothetical protein
MSRIPDRDAKLEYCRFQLQEVQAHITFWQTKILSGAYKLDTTKRGREPSEEERAKGEVIGWRDLTDEEKLQGCMGTLHTHVKWVRILGEVYHALLFDEPKPTRVP